VRHQLHQVEHVTCRRRYVGLRLHDLRHALGQWSHDAGVPLSRIKEMLRHTTLAMTERYARTAATRQVSSAVGKMLRDTAS
jgi:integrase